ncbi:hypothetical protein [Leptospira santarosai]
MESPEKVSFDDRGLGFWILGIILVLLLFFLIFAFIASGSCGIDLFIGIPLSVGILAAFTRSIYKRVTPGEIFLITAYLGAVLLLGFLFVREESLICLLMSIPITYLPLLIGAWIGYKIQNKNWSKYFVVPIVLFFNISAHVFDRLDVESQRNVIKTTIVVRSSLQKVWKRILSPFEFGEAKNFFFRNGVPYPTSMKVVTTYGPRMLECEYTNGRTSGIIGEFTEDAPMKFVFPTQQVTMQETYFGEFRLIPIGKGEVKIEATTRYFNRLGPKFYWKLWSDYLIDETHQHILQKIKLSVERKGKQNE